MDIDMEQIMERDLTQKQPTTIDGLIVTTALPQLGDAQRANIQHQNDGNEMNIPQHGHLAAQGADGLGFQPLMGPEQEQSEDEPEHDQGQLDLNNLPDNPGNEGPLGLTQETRRSEANKGSSKPRLKSSRKKMKGYRQLQLRFRTAHADVGQEALTGGETIRDSSQQKLNSRTTTTITGGKLITYIIAWQTINCKEFMQKGFYLIFKDKNSQE
ncbi:MAG: hypothetical protein EZS28_015990 [Streblomastix strix]|uniref:Uncharacterized protein n=1 Tax=Streblomastix strix TaxID=222440 RepID=A0A5J4W1Z0_9EUKA|nr:MAG: hypothetical protein EZS28_015990 [Streblomastix strix]